MFCTFIDILLLDSQLESESTPGRNLLDSRKGSRRKEYQDDQRAHIIFLPTRGL